MQRGGHRLQLLEDVVLFEELLLVERLHVDQRRQDVGEPDGIFDMHDDVAQFLGHAGGDRERLLDQLLDTPDVRLDLNRLLTRVGQRRDLRAQRVAGSREDVGAHPRQSLDDDVDAAGRGLRHLTDDANGTDALEILSRGFVGVVVLEHEQNQTISGERAVHAFERHRPIHGERLQRLREKHRVTERQDGEL